MFFLIFISFTGPNSSAGLSNILRKLVVDPRHPDCVPESVVLVMKQILAIEQSFEVHTFTELGLMARPPVGAGIFFPKFICLFRCNKNRYARGS